MAAKLYHSCIRGLLLSCLPLSAGVVTAGYESVVTQQISPGSAEIPPWIKYETGVAYINGEGVKQNLKQGRYWIHLAARQGIPLAQYNLGVMFYDGIGGERNPGCAQWWLQRAHDQQQDSDVQIMSEQALSALTSEAWSQPKIYRAPILSDCDRLPAVYGTDTGTAEEVADTDIGSRTEKFRIRWNMGGLSLIQRFRDVITEFKEKRLSSGSARVVTRVTLSADEQEELPGVAPGKLPESHLPAEASEINKPELSENIILMQELPKKTAFLPPMPSERIYKEAESAREPVTTALPAPLPNPPQKVTQEVRSQKEQITIGNLSTAPGKHFTVQLASAATPEGLYASAKQYHLKNYLVYETVRHNREWYVLVAGEYPTRLAAFQAITGLPHEFQKNGAWVRPLRQVQNELKHIN